MGGAAATLLLWDQHYDALCNVGGGGGRGGTTRWPGATWPRKKPAHNNEEKEDTATGVNTRNRSSKVMWNGKVSICLHRKVAVLGRRSRRTSVYPRLPPQRPQTACEHIQTHHPRPRVNRACVASWLPLPPRASPLTLRIHCLHGGHCCWPWSRTAARCSVPLADSPVVLRVPPDARTRRKGKLRAMTLERLLRDGRLTQGTVGVEWWAQHPLGPPVGFVGSAGERQEERGRLWPFARWRPRRPPPAL